MARMFPLILMQMFGDNVSSELCLQIEPFFRPFEACARIYEVNP
jgi:hypothetical protein